MPVIAIDGPSGSGKSTLAAALAATLGIARLDTGAMYRAVAYLAIRTKTPFDDGAALARLAAMMDFRDEGSPVLNGEDVGEQLRSAEVTRGASVISQHQAVRSELVARQRGWITAHNGGVIEGRDIGSVVAPDADVKVFLTADLSERARRRMAETPKHEIAEDAMDASGISESIIERDQRDATRASSPLVVPDGAVVIDSTTSSVEEVVAQVLALL